MPNPQVQMTQSQYDRRTWWLLGLAIFMIGGFTVTVPTLFVALYRSGYLEDRVPAGLPFILIGLIGLTAIFCLLMIHQQSQINRIRHRMVMDQMELEQARGRLAELTSLFQLGNTLQMELPLDTVLEITVRRLASTLHSHDACIYLFDPEARTLSCKATFGLRGHGAEPDAKYGEGPVGWVARHKEGIVMRAGERGSRFADFFATHPDTGSVLVLPLVHEKRCVAVIQVCRPTKADPFRIEHRDIGQLFAENIGAIIDRAQAMVRLRQTAASVSTPSQPTESETSAFRDVFLTAASSELKAPLTTIVAYSEVLDQNDSKMTPAMRREFAGRLRGEAQRIMTLVDDVLDLVRLELGRYLLDLHFSNVNPIARAALETVQPLADTRGLTVDLDIDGAIPDQHLDPTKLKQSILALLRNAVRFSPAKGRIRLRTSLDVEGVLIEIRDQGPPIPPEASSAVFDLESIGESYGRRCKDGHGLGLHLTRRFVELHGGSVGSGPSPEGGAVFWIRLPKGEDLSSLFGSAPYVEELARV